MSPWQLNIQKIQWDIRYARSEVLVLKYEEFLRFEKEEVDKTKITPPRPMISVTRQVLVEILRTKRFRNEKTNARPGLLTPNGIVI